MARSGSRSTRRVHGAVPVARRTLFQDRRRALLSVCGVAAALTLVLILNGVVAGAMRQVTAYIDHSPGDVFVAQSGVRTMHMSITVLPDDTVEQVRKVDGVAWAEPLRYTNSIVQRGDAQLITYVLGYDTATGRTGPQKFVAGRAPRAGEVVVDQAAAKDLGIRVGDRVQVLGAPLRVSGLSTNGTNLVNTTVFLSLEQFSKLRGPGTSYVIAGADPGVAPADLAKRIAAQVPNTTVQTRSAFSRQEASLVRDMAADIMTIMTLIGLLIALAVVGLTLFTVTLSRLREYGVMKALGAATPRLAGQVVAQAAWTVGLALIVAVVASAGLGMLLDQITPNIRIVIEPKSVLRSAVLACAVGGLAAVIPLRRVTKVDPASAFRRAA